MIRLWLYGIHVGDLGRLGGGQWEFRFSEEYLVHPTRPVLGRWFEDQDLHALRYKAPQGLLPAFFQNYIPERDSALRELLARKAGVDPKHNAPLLAALGEDLPGALVAAASPDVPDSLDDVPLRDIAVPRDTALRFSLAGMQLKFSVMRAETKFTLPVTGRGGRWIAKLPDARHASVPEHEHAMLSLAARVGIDVPLHELVPWRDIANLPTELDFTEPFALVVRRYDRLEDGARVHQEDFAQVFDRQPSDKYNELAASYTLDATFRGIGRVIQGVCPTDFPEYVRRLVFMVLTGNHDAHLKNWSLYYPDCQRARLTPAYDLLSTIIYVPEQTELALRLFKKQHFADVLRSDFERLAVVCGAPVAPTLSVVDETVARFREAWSEESRHLPLPERARDLLDAHLASLPLAR